MSDSPDTTSKPIVVGLTNTTKDSTKPGTTDRVGKPWRVSNNLLQFLGIWESGIQNGENFAHQIVTNGFILKVYNDSRGLPTVGAGHLVLAADKLKLGDEITEAQAKQLLKLDIATAEDAVNKHVKIPLHDHEYDALVSLTFNTGAHGASKLFHAVNKGKYGAIPSVIKKYRTGGGNAGRRDSEARLFKSGVYDASH